MANLGNLSQQVGELLPLMAKAIHYQHYTQHVVLLETVCKQVSWVQQPTRAFKGVMYPFRTSCLHAVNKREIVLKLVLL